MSESNGNTVGNIITEKNGDEYTNTIKSKNDVMSSSSSSYYSTAEEDLECEGELQKTLQPAEEPVTPTRSWVTGTVLKKEKNVNKEPIRKTKSYGPSSSSGMNVPIINNQRISPIHNKSPGSKSNLLESIPGAEINQLQSPNNLTYKSNPHPNPKDSTTDDDDEFKSFDSWSPDGKPISVNDLQKVFDCFKSNNLSSEECVSF